MDLGKELRELEVEPMQWPEPTQQPEPVKVPEEVPA